MTETHSPGPPIVGSASALAERVSSATGFLVGFDYDGTLTPIGLDPSEPMIDDGMKACLGRLAERANVQVAVVSGRELADLDERVSIENVVLAGNHGLELLRNRAYTIQSNADQYRPALQSLCEVLRSRVAEIPGCRVENKGLTLAVHVRQTPADRVSDVRRVVEKTVSERPGFQSNRGKQVFDVRPSVSHHKGTTIELLAAENPSDWLTLYLGDDTTDEYVFETIQPEGVGIRIGTSADTEATYQIPTQQDVPEFVRWLTAAVVTKDY